jgi:hypothetical protein
MLVDGPTDRSTNTPAIPAMARLLSEALRTAGLNA